MSSHRANHGTSNPRPSRRIRTRPKLCICTCRSYCRTLNPISGVYEGSGCWIPRGTRDSHVRDDRRRLQNGTRIRAMAPHVNSQVDHEGDKSYGAQATIKIKLLQDEIEWLSGCPVSSLATSFVFCNNPVSTGIFIMPLQDETIRPNHGLYALRSDCGANRAFLHAENRYCNMLWTIYRMQGANVNPLGLEETREMILEQLTRLNREKYFQWAQQRVHVNDSGAILVNTGKYKHTLSIFTLFDADHSTSFLAARTVGSCSKSSFDLHTHPREYPFYAT
jgi:hypothetical protein